MRTRILLPLIALIASGVLAPAGAQTLSLKGTLPAEPTTVASVVNSDADLRRIWVRGNSGFLQGESAAGVWPLFVKASEIGGVTALQISYSASVSVSPGVSRLHVFLNDHAIGEIELKGGEQGVVRRLQVEPGLLTPGLNALRVEFESVHRVDCSAEATYELWTRVDPSATGLMVARSTLDAHAPAGDVSDLLTTRTSADGVTPIYVRAPLNPDPTAAERLIKVVDALARNLRLPNPEVTFGAPPKGDAGLELAMATRDQLANDHFDAAGRDRISTTAADARPLVLLTGADVTSVDQQAQALIAELNHFRLGGSQSGLRAALQVAGTPIDGDTTVRLADLGLDNGEGHGRRWERNLTLSLPQNFVASVYQQALLRLKGSAPGGLLPGSDLRVRVNDVGAADLPISGEAAVDLDGQSLYLPFSLFHPGVNKVTLEAVTVSPDDVRCDSASRRPHAQFRLSPETTLTFPHFTRLQVGPDVSRMLAVRSAARNDRIQVALMRPDVDTLASAMTILANLSVQGRDAEVDMTYGRPRPLGEPGMAFGPISEVPPELSHGLNGMYVDGAEVAYVPTDEGATTIHTPDADLRPMTLAEGGGGQGLWVRLVRNLRWLGFAFDDPSQHQKLIMRPGDVLVAETPTRSWGATRAGFAIPTIGTVPTSWLVFASQTNEQLRQGVHALVASDAWESFHGQAAIFEPSTNRIAALSQGAVFYTLPADWTVADLRDAMAIIFSDHIVAYVGVLLLLTTLLSALTAALIFQRPKER